MTRPLRRFMVAALLVAATLAAADARQTPPADHVLIVTLDGLRWQELFGGMQKELLTKDARGVRDAAAVERRFGGAAAEERRARLLPFFWTVVAAKGQVFGDGTRGSVASVTNTLRFSYPGYNELLSGVADPRIDSNDRVPNPNVTVLEWLHRKPAFAGRVAAFASWELLPWILNQPRSGIPSNGEGAPVAAPETERERLLNAFAAELPP